MGQYKKFWYLLVAVLIGAFSILGYYGFEVYREAPPIPQQYVSESGEKVITHDDILHGQTAWQTTGGMQVGSVWGHGAYQAPDWTADWLHRELTNWLDITANQEFGKNFADLNDEQQTLLKARLTKEYRGSKVENGTVVLSNTRLAAMEKTAQYYISLYGDDPATKVTREHFAMKDNTLPDLQARKDFSRTDSIPISSPVLPRIREAYNSRSPPTAPPSRRSDLSPSRSMRGSYVSTEPLRGV